MTWDIRPGREEEYFEFHIQKFVPMLEKMGLKLSEAWLTVYGDGDQPRMMAEAKMSSLGAAQKVLRSVGWDDLGHHLDDYVENFDYKVVSAQGGFQI
jgi:hypothetical protein